MAETIDVLDPLTPAAEKHHRIWRSVHRVKKLSDRVVGIGPFGVGVDGLLTWIPGAGVLYSVGAGGFLVAQAVRAEAKPTTIARMVGYLALDVATSEIPLIGDAFDFFLPAHWLAATALQKDIEDRHGAPPEVLPNERARKTKKPRFR